ncbi:MAG: hypothetical protein KA480_17405 [Anaerolineales bacterium]|nr:hypothetical protein [Anaerolineales bacterium]
MSQEPMSSDISSDDKLWAALSYLPFLWPIISVIMLFWEDKKVRPFIKFHAVQSIVIGIAAYVLYAACGIGFLVHLYMLYLAYDAYQGNYSKVPALTDFIKNQGWV